MLSVVVFIMDGPAAPLSAEAVVRTLSSLVPAAVEGVVRDVTLAAPAGRAGMRKIADHAGCELVEAGSQPAMFRRAFETVRNPNIFVIRAGRAPEQGFAEELADLLAGGVQSAIMRETPRRFMTRILPGLAPVAGLVARRDPMLRTQAHTLGDLVRNARATTTLRARARFVE